MAKKKVDHSIDVEGNVDHSVVVSGNRNKVWFVTVQAIRRHWLIAIIALVLLSVGISGVIVWQQWKTDKQIDTIPTETADEVAKQFQDPESLAERMREHIRKKSAVEIEAARTRGAKWKEIRELERRRDVALEQVDEVIKTIREGLAGQPDPIFREASRILAEEGVDAALGYLASHQQDILARVDRLAVSEAQAREEKRKALESLMLQADLHETNLAWDKALAQYQTVAEKAPGWSRARRKLGDLLVTLADYADAERHLKTALDLAEDDQQRALAANSLGILYLHQARYREAEPQMRRALEICEASLGGEHPQVAVALNNLAALLLATNRLSEAEPLMRRALAIDEQSYGAEHRRVAVQLNNLAQLLRDTNRLSAAEPLMRRALDIVEQSYGVAHPEVAISLNNLALLLQDTNRLLEAEPLMRRALSILENSHGAKHPQVADCINNLAQLLKATSRLPGAELLMRRALAIWEDVYGADHPQVATGLSNLARLLQDTNRHAEAKPLLLRALTIDEQFHGAEHPFVAICLNNLIGTLWDTKSPAELKPLSRRQLEIFVLFAKENGHKHPYFDASRANYSKILEAMNLEEDQIQRELNDADQVINPLKPIVPETKGLLGPDKSTKEVLDALDRQYRKEGKPDVWFLPLDEPISPFLDELMGPVTTEPNE